MPPRPELPEMRLAKDLTDKPKWPKVIHAHENLKEDDGSVEKYRMELEEYFSLSQEDLTRLVFDDALLDRVADSDDDKYGGGPGHLNSVIKKVR